jgi:hypothetical protein
MKSSHLNYFTPEVLKFILETDKIDINNLPLFELNEYCIGGVYFLFNKKNELVYVGKSQDIFFRLKTHRAENKKDFYTCRFMSMPNYKTDTEKVKFYERFFINKFLPIYNVDFVTLKIKNNGK